MRLRPRPPHRRPHGAGCAGGLKDFDSRAKGIENRGDLQTCVPAAITGIDGGTAVKRHASL
jgi:hypothetical protein